MSRPLSNPGFTALALAMFLAWACSPAHGAAIPRAMLAHRTTLVRLAHLELGLAAPIASLAAQVQQESGGRVEALSSAGAIGLGQFMPRTAKWLGELRPDLGPVAPHSPAWSLRALCAYMKWLLARVQACDTCNRWAMAQSAYNGGLGWVRRDAALARELGLDPLTWWGAVETVNAGRSAAAKRENRGYPRRILLTLEPLYEASGWGRGVCP